jgi:hypothetical protein
MEGRSKVTKEVLCEEARFILANVLAEARYGRQNRFDDIRRVCEGAVSIPFAEYIGFLEKSGYLRHDRTTESLEVSADGEQVVNGANLTEFTDRAVAHFKKLRQSRIQQQAAPGLPPMGSQSGVVASTVGTVPREDPRRDVSKPMISTSSARSGVVSGHASGGGHAAHAPAQAAGDFSGELDARFEKLAQMGSGGVGTVYRARQIALGREVALKEIRDLFGFFSEEQRGEIVRRFSEVVRAAGSLAHPNILPIHDVNLETEFPYVVSELATFGSARRLINDAEEVPVALAFKYLLQTLHALRAAHAQQVFHRGLKPEQLLIDGYGNLKVSDFGFSRIVERDHAVIRQVYVGMGNVAYMAPELYTDPNSTGAQTDIYALGIIFYELLTRKLPGRRSPMPSQINASLPKGIDDIFDRMTRDARDERYASVDDILADIDRLQGLEGIGERQSVLVGDNPLSTVKFRPGAEDAMGMPLDGDGSHRPYSFQQRRSSKKL